MEKTLKVFLPGVKPLAMITYSKKFIVFISYYVYHLQLGAFLFTRNVLLYEEICEKLDVSKDVLNLSEAIKIHPNRCLWFGHVELAGKLLSFEIISLFNSF